MKQADDLPVLTFESAAHWEEWLAQHRADTKGLWVKLAKKASGIPSVTYDEAVDIALCYGWIDGLKRGFDEHYHLQKFTPRRARSMWSKRNIEKTKTLIAAGKMQPAGLAEIDRAKADGRWAAAYDSPANMVMPEDFLAMVKQNKKAYEFYQTLNKTNTYAIAWRLATAKRPETRERRMQTLLTMLEQGGKLH